MMRLFNVYFPKRTLLLVATEGTLIILSLAAAAAMLGTGPADLVLSDPQVSVKIGVTSLVFIVCMYYFDLYDSVVLSNPREVTTRVIQVLGTVCLFQVVLYYVFRSLQLDQKVFLLGLVLVALLVSLWRTAFFALLRIPRLAQRAVLLGSSQLAPALAAEIEKRPELGIHLVGYVGRSPDSNHDLNGLRHLGEPENFLDIFEAQRIDRVIVAMADQRGNLPLADLLKLKTRGVRIEDGTDLYEAVAGKVPIQSLRMSWLVFSPGFRLSPRMLVYKRVFSIILSLIALIFALPLMVIIAVAIRLSSHGPVIFRQKRVGRDGKIFTLYKFRSMHQGADRDQGPHPALKNDPRITRVGRWIRPPRLDELPQLYNILRGDMYFVGPRPFVPSEEEKLLEQIPFYAQRLTVKPGATGWAQVHRGYCATLEDNIEKLEYDLFYIKNASVGLDILTVLTTLKILLLGRGGR